MCMSQFFLSYSYIFILQFTRTTLYKFDFAYSESLCKAKLLKRIKKIFCSKRNGIIDFMSQNTWCRKFPKGKYVYR